MDKQKGARWLYITLLIAAILIGVWMVIDLILDDRAPETTPTPQAQASATPAAEQSPAASEAPVDIPADRAQAMDFSLENLAGDTVSLADQRGKVTVINFWGAWCGWCMEEMPHFAEMVEHYGDDVAFLFVDYGDSADTAKKAMEEFGIPLEKVLMDSQNTVVDLYQVEGFPTTYIIDKEGGIAETFVGYSTKEDVMPVIDALQGE